MLDHITAFINKAELAVAQDLTAQIPLEEVAVATFLVETVAQVAVAAQVLEEQMETVEVV